MKEINIKPEMGIYRVLKYLKYSTWFAISEFIDNSLQSFISKKNLSSSKRDKCIVNIKFEDRKIIIKDNAFGISENEHSRAFTAGIPPSNNEGLSEFGVGMKSAAIWFAPKWKVKTQPYESNLEFEYKELPEDDPKRRVPSILLAKEVLNWEPKIELKDGLVKTIDWFKQNIAI